MVPCATEGEQYVELPGFSNGECRYRIEIDLESIDDEVLTRREKNAVFGNAATIIQPDFEPISGAINNDDRVLR